MKKFILLAFVGATLISTPSCKKCWDCGIMVDGKNQKVCDKQQKELYESGTFTDVNGNPIRKSCK